MTVDKKSYQISQLAEMTSSKLKGNGEIIVENARGVSESIKTSITFADQTEYLREAVNSEAAAVVISEKIFSEIDSELKEKKSFLITENPRRVYAQIADLLTPKPYETEEISEKAVINEKARVGENVSIHPGVVIAENAEIGDNTILAPGVIIGPDVKIAENCLLHQGVIV